MDVIHDQVFAALTPGIDAEITPSLANLREQNAEVLCARIAGQRNGLDAGVAILELTLV